MAETEVDAFTPEARDGTKHRERYFAVPLWLLWIGLGAGAVCLALYWAGVWIVLPAPISVSSASSASASSPCSRQLKNRDDKSARLRTEIRSQEARVDAFQQALDHGLPGARNALSAEKEELENMQRQQRELEGVSSTTKTLSTQLLLLAVTIAVCIGAAAVASRHAQSAGFRPIERARDLLVPLFWCTLTIFAVAAWVIYEESFDPKKTSFDSVSACLAPVPFWISHSCLLPLAIAAAVPGAVGWYFTRSDHVPQPDPARYGWGVTKYVRFIETWSFITVCSVGFVGGIWIHTLSPTRTDYISLFVGFGALAVSIALIARFVMSAVSLRNACERILEASSDPSNLPPDPVDGMIGKNSWQLPALFSAAFGVAYKLLEVSGLGAVLKLH